MTYLKHCKATWLLVWPYGFDVETCFHWTVRMRLWQGKARFIGCLSTRSAQYCADGSLSHKRIIEQKCAVPKMFNKYFFFQGIWFTGNKSNLFSKVLNVSSKHIFPMMFGKVEIIKFVLQGCLTKNSFNDVWRRKNIFRQCLKRRSYFFRKFWRNKKILFLGGIWRLVQTCLTNKKVF